jgi:hypothetical protein
MSQPIWQLEYSIECAASSGLAWRYWTNIGNWNDPPAEFELVGPFDAGSRLITRMPGQAPWQSIIREVIPERAATIEMQLSGAVLSFHWQFVPLSPDRTRIAQRLWLDGPNAAAFIEHMAAFERNLADGMKKVAAAIERANASS